MLAVHVLAFGPDHSSWRHVVSSDLGIVLLYAALTALLGCNSGPCSRPGSNPALLWSVFKPVGFATVLVLAGVRLSGGGTFTLPMLVGASVLNFAGIYVRGECIHRVTRWWGQRTAHAKNVLVVGTGQVARRIASYLDSHPEHRRVVAGFLDPGWRSGERVLGSIEDLARIGRTEFVDEVIIALPHQHENARRAVLAALREHLDVRIVPDLFGCSPAEVSIEDLGGIPLVQLHEEYVPAAALLCKRMVDIALSAAGLLLAAPLMLVIAVAIKMDSPGPVLYCALRAGRKGRPFLFYKFRTMDANADRQKEELRQKNERIGPMFKIAKDPRITRLGRLLRRHSLDELPQLWNVLLGDMSLVGPRPHPLDDFRRYTPQHLRRLDMTPGVTGAWQISARREASFNKSMELDLAYIENWSLWTDMRILLRTVPAVLRGTGV